MAKKYSILVENDKVVAVEIDGVRYNQVDDIPDEDDRDKMFFLVESWPSEEWAMPAAAGKAFLLPRLIVPLFLGIALLMLGIAAFSGISTYRALTHEVTAQGHVENLRESSDSSGKPFYYPVVGFCLPDETCKTVELTSGSSPASYEVGQEVTVAYDPQKPSNAHIASLGDTIGRYTLTLITGVLGLAFVAGTLLARWVMKPGRAEG
jgi:hypothetical protein